MSLDILNLTSDDRKRLHSVVGPLKSVSEFCSDLAEVEKDSPLKETLSKLLPWAAKGGEFLGEVAPLAKILVKIVDELAREKDPAVLGLVACTLAYQRAATLALVQVGKPDSWVPFERPIEQAKEDLKRLDFHGSLAGLSLKYPFAHPFVWNADQALRLVVQRRGYNDREWRQIQRRVHEQFRSDLVEVLTHGESSSRFEPFTKWLVLGDGSAAYAALYTHVERQRWLFENRPVLNKEPFALSDVYVDTDCGKLTWKDFERASSEGQEREKRFDPFSEDCGGRHPLLATVLEYLGQPGFDDAIVIQGSPGAGKSAFTLRLTNVLRQQGLRPLRISLRLLTLRKNLKEDLADAVSRPEEEEDRAASGAPYCPDPFLRGAIFQEKTVYGNAEICPYILILDGWDEITVSVNEGFEKEVSRMLDNVRREFLGPRSVPVRVILTGRPSSSIERSQFLGDNTPVLTLRPYTAEQLKEYGSKLRRALESKPIDGENVEAWPPVDWSHLEQVFTLYQKDPGKMEVLGLPLLAHLSLRLMVEWKGRIEDLLSNPTDLYRSLTDLTCSKAGKAEAERQDLRQQARLRGLALRRTLQRTAAAITAYGHESIPFQELRLRLALGKTQMMQEAEAAGHHQPLTDLMISFYFKGGKAHLGCEFLHKSFREYLYAEGIVDALKKYGTAAPGVLALRTPYWKDFEKSDPRHKFSRELGELLSPRRLTYEILRHLEQLIAWEIDRSQSPRGEKTLGEPLDPISSEQWDRVRDGLADLWDWWAEGAHLRPQPHRDRSDTLQYDPTYASELEDLAFPRDRTAEAPEWPPGRLVNIDSNLGDALCRLNAWVHKQLLSSRGWTPELPGGEEQVPDSETRPCQARLRFADSTFVFFRPSGASGNYFANYIHRINAAGAGHAWRFPAYADLRAVDLRGVDLRHAHLQGTKLGGANLDKVNLSGADLRGANLAGADLRRADLRWANLVNANLSSANIEGVKGDIPDVINVFRPPLPERVKGPALSGRPVGVDVDWFGWGDFTSWLVGVLTLALGPDLQKARLRGANLRGTNLSRGDLTGSDLRGANLEGVVFQLPTFAQKAGRPGAPE